MGCKCILVVAYVFVDTGSNNWQSVFLKMFYIDDRVIPSITVKAMPSALAHANCSSEISLNEQYSLPELSNQWI